MVPFPGVFWGLLYRVSWSQRVLLGNEKTLELHRLGSTEERAFVLPGPPRTVGATGRCDKWSDTPVHLPWRPPAGKTASSFLNLMHPLLHQDDADSPTQPLSVPVPPGRSSDHLCRSRGCTQKLVSTASESAPPATLHPPTPTPTPRMKQLNHLLPGPGGGSHTKRNVNSLTCS